MARLKITPEIQEAIDAATAKATATSEKAAAAKIKTFVKTATDGVVDVFAGAIEALKAEGNKAAVKTLTELKKASVDAIKAAA